MKRLLLFVVSAIFFASCSEIREPALLIDFVNPLQGTMSDNSFSTGNTYPAIALPWGMNFWTPQTRENGNGWQYVYSDTVIQGFKQTHQPSPWINDYGCYSIMPVSGVPIYDQKKRALKFKHEYETSSPYYYSVKFESGLTTEISPTYSGAVFRILYPENAGAYLVIDCFPDSGSIQIFPGQRKVIGYSKYYAPNNNAHLPDNFATYFVITFNKDIKVAATGNNSEEPEEGSLESKGKNVIGWIKFDSSKGAVEVKMTSSFISSAQAQINFDREVALLNFEQAKNNAKRIWNNELSRIKVSGGSDEQNRIFYSALYRMMLFPRNLSEYNSEARQIHYSFFKGTVEQGPMFGDNGFWDTFRAVHPFFTIMYPEKSSEIMNGLLNFYREGGWLPEWTSPAYKDCMIGQHSVSIVTDAYVKGIRNYDTGLMFEAMEKGANNQGPNATGRSGWQYYNRLGYIPYDAGIKESVSKTLEYAYNDFCLSQYARLIGKDEATIRLYRNRAENYKNVFDKSINFVRPKDSIGNWQEPYTPDTWGGSFTEGSAWHWTWCVYHDPTGLMKLMGGRNNFIEKLDSVFVAKPTFTTGYYGREIHEMTEMVAGKMGQYAHGNQPIQHMIYLYNYAGVPYKTHFHVRDVMDKLYHSGMNDGRGYCGDEDNGQTSAWYVFSAMGFYPVCPGRSEYVIGSPIFNNVTLKLNNGKSFSVNAINNSPKNIYIQSATLNNRPFDKTYITHQQILSGGTLKFVMGSKPNMQWGTSPESKPHSMSDGDQ